METDFKCNAFKCRKPLPSDADAKAVVTTCSHIFCVDCANQLFSTAMICPACETTLSEPDDVVVCSMRPTNDYKTTILSGLNPVTILEICGRAISFWNYQVQQENSFQQIIFKNANEKMAQMQKQLDNVIREANGQIGLLNDKVSGLERDLELERRRAHDLQEVSRERDKEYQKLKNQLDKYKRKALLATGPSAALNIGADRNIINGSGPHGLPPSDRQNAPTFAAGLGQLHSDTVGSTPRRQTNSMDAFGQQSVHSSRSRPHRVNASNQQQPFGGFRSGSPNGSMSSARLSGEEGTRQHRQSSRPVQLHHPSPALFGTSNMGLGQPAAATSRRSGNFFPSLFSR